MRDLFASNETPIKVSSRQTSLTRHEDGEAPSPTLNLDELDQRAEENERLAQALQAKAKRA